MPALSILRQFGAPVNRVSKTRLGYKLSAPHRVDRNPSFAVWRANNEYPDDDPRAWIVKDFAEGFAMRLDSYLNQYFGANLKFGKTKSFKAKKRPKENAFSRVVSRLKMLTATGPEIEPEEGEPYPGHGFEELGVDSRDYGIYVGKDGKPRILFRDPDGKPFAIKRRNGTPKYIWEKYHSEVFFARWGTSKTIIVAEGEMKAAALAAMYPDCDVIGMCSKSLMGKAPVHEHDNILFVLDPDHDYTRDDALLDTLYVATLTGKRVKVLDFDRVITELKVWGGKDVNDAIVWVGRDRIWEIKRAIKKWSRRPKFPKSYLVKNLPMIPMKPSEYQLFAALWTKAMSEGKWGNGIISIEFSPIEAMRVAGFHTLSTYYQAAKGLAEKGYIRYTSGQLGGNGKGKTRTYRLMVNKVLEAYRSTYENLVGMDKENKGDNSSTTTRNQKSISPSLSFGTNTLWFLVFHSHHPLVDLKRVRYQSHKARFLFIELPDYYQAIFRLRLFISRNTLEKLFNIDMRTILSVLEDTMKWFSEKIGYTASVLRDVISEYVLTRNHILSLLDDLDGIIRGRILFVPGIGRRASSELEKVHAEVIGV